MTTRPQTPPSVPPTSWNCWNCGSVEHLNAGPRVALQAVCHHWRGGGAVSTYTRNHLVGRINDEATAQAGRLIEERVQPTIDEAEEQRRMRRFN